MKKLMLTIIALTVATVANAGNYTMVDNNIIDKINQAGITTVKEAILSWLSKRNGMSDMVFTLAILFGRVD